MQYNSGPQAASAFVETAEKETQNKQDRQSLPSDLRPKMNQCKYSRG